MQMRGLFPQPGGVEGLDLAARRLQSTALPTAAPQQLLFLLLLGLLLGRGRRLRPERHHATLIAYSFIFAGIARHFAKAASRGAVYPGDGLGQRAAFRRAAGPGSRPRTAR